MSLYDLKDLYSELKNDPMCREKILEYYRTTDLEERMEINHHYYI